MEDTLIQLGIYVALTATGYFFGLQKPRKLKYPLTISLKNDADIYNEPNGDIYDTKVKGRDITAHKTKYINGIYWHRIEGDGWIRGKIR